MVVLVVQWLGVGLVIERSLVRLQVGKSNARLAWLEIGGARSLVSGGR